MEGLRWLPARKGVVAPVVGSHSLTELCGHHAVAMMRPSGVQERGMSDLELSVQLRPVDRSTNQGSR